MRTSPRLELQGSAMTCAVRQMPVDDCRPVIAALFTRLRSVYLAGGHVGVLMLRACDLGWSDYTNHPRRSEKQCACLIIDTFLSFLPLPPSPKQPKVHP